MSGSSASSVFPGGSSYDLTSTSHSQASQSQAFDGFDFGFSEPSDNADDVSEGIQPAIQDPTSTRSYPASLIRLDSRRWTGTESAAEILQAADFSSSSSDGTVGQTDTRADMPVPSSAGGEDSSFASIHTVEVSEPEVDSSFPMSATVDFSQGCHHNYLGHDGDGDVSEDGTSIEPPSNDTQSTHTDIPPPPESAPTGLGVTLTDGSSSDRGGYRRQYPSIISSATSALTHAIDKRLLARGDLGDDTDRSDANSLQYSFDNQEESISVIVNSPTQPPESPPYDFRYAPTSQWDNSNALSTFDTSQSAPTPEARGFEHILSDMTRERERVSESRQDENEGGSVTSKTSRFSVSRAKKRLSRVPTSMSASHMFSRASGFLTSAASSAFRRKGKKPVDSDTAGSERHSWMRKFRRKNPYDDGSRSGSEDNDGYEYQGGPGDQYSHASDMPGGEGTAFDKETAGYEFYK